MLLEFLNKLVEVFKEYFKEVQEESIRDNFVIIYELLDEMMDFGFPQVSESKVLQQVGVNVLTLSSSLLLFHYFPLHSRISSARTCLTWFSSSNRSSISPRTTMFLRFHVLLWP
mmetsp:Transcript_7668/g.34082  ORF Transcript_7668/g.34082 Transcript_7668/m.34082 type:complete len:114 (+) Transcript_7668:531-872(+)